MAALVQTLPQQSGSVTMLQQPRTPSAAAAMISPPAQTQSGQYQQLRTRRSVGAPIQPYAFTSTPTIGPPGQRQQLQLQTVHARSGSTPSTSTASSFDSVAASRPRHLTSVSMTNLPRSAVSGFGTGASGSRDDSALPPQRPRVSPTGPRPQSAYMSGSSAQVSLAQAVVSTSMPPKSTPDRYRRNGPRWSDGPVVAPAASASGIPIVGQVYAAPQPASVANNGSGRIGVSNRTGVVNARPNSYYLGNMSPSAVADDSPIYRQTVPEETRRRFRRRSMHTLDSADYPNPLSPQEFSRPGETTRVQDSALQHQQQQQDGKSSSTSSALRPATAPSGSTGTMPARHSRHGSVDSARSSRSSSKSNHTNDNARPSSSDSSPVNVPPRSSSATTDVSKRAHNPSPLSKPVTMEADSVASVPADSCSPPSSSSTKPSSSHSNTPNKASLVDSPAAKQLAAINEKGKKAKGKTSRLRRAFSFGSAAEFRSADSGGSTHAATTTTTPAEAEPKEASKEHSKLHKERNPDDAYDEEQARIAQKQEEGGIGINIYGGRLFSGSSDNLSISSTASSASIMIRKMGRGMKKGTRSLVGLFRPKSIIGAPGGPVAPALDATKVPESSTAAVSMVTVEAERERVNVNADPHAQPGGGTGFPHLERNSAEPLKDSKESTSVSSERVGSSGTGSSSRKSIVGGEQERAEVLAAVRKKGILKTRGSSSPSPRPQENQSPFGLPDPPAISESPNSSAPSTPNSEAQGHKRSESVAIGSEDYFMTALRIRQDTKSAPNTPNGTVKRNATFSPRIVFHDTWPSGEYDRRGDVATCNRLTPMLAQQIKEELNNFKMEMEVHENSKIYTHFF